MLVPKKITWWSLVFKYRGSELPRTQWRIAGVAATALIVTVLEERFDWHPNLTPLPFTLVGIALGIFLGFRNNASYDRWWEGRKLWGALVNTTRSFARQSLTLVGPRVAESEGESVAQLRRELVLRIIAFAHALERLRVETNRPYAINHGTAERLRAAYARGWIAETHLGVLEGSMTALTDIQGACERIKSTPIPFSYTTLIHRITAGYCYALPFGLVDTVGFLTPAVCVIVAYAFFGLDVVGDELEMPFGNDPNDLPLDAISRMIEINLRQRLGETDLPLPLKPVDEILS
jgi:putative membrane protein